MGSKMKKLAVIILVLFVATVAAIRLRAGDSNYIISNNLFDGVNLATAAWGVYGTSPINLNISNNLLTRIATQPIGFTAAPTNADIHGNTGSESVATTSVEIQPYESTALAPGAGGLTATLPDGYYIGTKKQVRMTSATPMTLTVTHDANGAGGASSYVFDDVNASVEFVWNGWQWKSTVLVQ
jgi:hypothetical protein